MLSWAAASETRWANHAPIWTRIIGSPFSFFLAWPDEIDNLAARPGESSPTELVLGMI